MQWLRPDLYRRWSKSITGVARIFGIDPNLASLQRNPSPLNACAFATQISFRELTFDLVTANMVVEHLPDPDRVLSEVFRVLKPGSAFIFHTPNLRAPQVRLSSVLPYSLKRRIVPLIEGGRCEDDVFPTHYKLNDQSTIESCAIRAGFRVEWVRHVFTAPLSQMLGPLVIFELLLIKLFHAERFSAWRPDLICLLRKPEISTINDSVAYPTPCAE